MSYTNDILGCIEQVRDIANTGNSPAQSAVVPRTEYGLIKHLRDILDPTSTADALHPDSIFGFLTQIRDSLNTGNSPAFKATYTNDTHGLLIQIRDLVNRAETSAANYPDDELGLWQAIRDFAITQGFGVGVSTPAPVPPDDPLPPGEDIPDDPGNFDLGPFTVDVTGAVKLGGKKKNNGSTAKFLHNIQAELPITANRTYTMLYDPDWSGMAQSGSLTMVGFVFKAGNDFYLVGLRGDGSTGVHGYQVSGDGLWHATTGFTVSDEGAAAFGTRDGPNWLQLETSDDGTTITLRTSADGETWTDEFTDTIPPFGDITEVTQWGPGAFFNSGDSGTYGIDVQVWASAEATQLWTPAEISTLVWLDASDAANLSLTGSAVNQWSDLSGNNNHVVQATSGNKPAYNTTTKVINGLGVVEFGTDDVLHNTGGLTGFSALNTTTDTTDTFTTVMMIRDSDANDPNPEWGLFDISHNTSTNTIHNPFILSNSGGSHLHTVSSRGYGNNDFVVSVAEDKTNAKLVSTVGGRQRHQAFINGTGGTRSTADMGSSANTPTNLRVGALWQDVFFGNGAVMGELVMFYGEDNIKRQKVEGYLAWKWDTVALLNAAHPYKNAAPTLNDTAWTPNQLSTLEWWLQGDILTGADASNVTLWSDSSGYARNGTASANHPKLQTSELNGMNVVSSASSSSTAMQLTQGFMDGKTAATLYAVVKNDDASACNGFIEFNADGSTADQYPNSSGDLIQAFASTVVKTVPDPGDLTQWHIIGMRSAASDWKCYFNGTQAFSTATNTVGFNDEELFASGGGSYRGMVAEIMIFSEALSTDNRQRVEGYLAHKWGQQALLPVGHPYKSAAPEVSPVATVTYQTATSDPTSQTTHTFTSQAIGAANDTREVLVGVVGQAGRYVVSVTVGDIAATFVARRQSDLFAVEVWSALVPTGTTATVAVVWNSASPWGGIGIATSDSYLEVVDYGGSVISTTANASNVTLATVPGGYVFAVGQHTNVTSGNLTPRNLTERSDINIGNAVFFAIGDAVPSGTSLAVGMDLNGGATADVNSHFLAVSFRRKPAAGALWTPAAFGHALRLWLKADGLLMVDGSNVSTWEDASGYQHDATSAAQPTLETNELDGKSIVRAVSTNSDLMALEDFAAQPSPRAGTVIMLVKSGAGQGAILWSGGDAGNNDHYPLDNADVYTSVGTSARKAMGNVGDVKQWHLGCFRSATNDYKYYFNAVQAFTTGTNTVAWNLTPKLFTSPVSALFITADLAEIIMVNGAVTQAQREKLEGYLAHKWGQQALLPGGHPYEDDPPLS